MKRLSYSIATIICCLLATSCEIDNFDGPNAGIQGTIYDHRGQPLQVGHGATIIRIRDMSWAKGDTTLYTNNQRLRVQYDGTYRNTKLFSGDYLMLPDQGNFYPYDDTKRDADDAGELVKISGTTTKDFTVTPYVTIDWVQKPRLTADGYIECSFRFTRNQKAGYGMPDIRDGLLKISRTLNNSSSDNVLFPARETMTNDMEGKEITWRTDIPVRYKGMDYYVRVLIACQAVAGDPTTNYPGLGLENCSTIEKIFVP